MKLLQKSNQHNLNVLNCFLHLDTVIFNNYNFLLTLLGSSIYLALTLIDLDFQDIRYHEKIQIIVTSTLFIFNIVFYVVKRVKQNFKIMFHILQMVIVLLSMEVFFLAEKGQSQAYFISLLQLQHILCQNIEKNMLIQFFVWLSVLYLSIRLFLMLEVYSSNSIIGACVIIFSYLFALVFGQNVEVSEQEQHLVNQIKYDVGEQIQQRTKNIFQLYKNSHISTKSYLNVNSNQPRIKERDKKSSTQILINRDGSNINHVEEQQNLNVTNQIQTPLVIGVRQRESQIESVINSYRLPKTEQQNMKSQLFSDTDKLNKNDIASHSSSNLLNQNLTNIPQNEEQQKPSLHGLEQNSILQELTIGLIIIDDAKRILFSNDRSHQILKENNQSNLINKLQEYQTYSKGYQNNNRQSNLYHQDLVKSASAKDVFEEKHSKQEKKPAYSQIQKMSSIILKEEDSCSPLLDPKKRKKDNKKGSVRIFPSLREIISQNNSIIEKESSKLIKTNIIINEDKLSSSDWKDDGLSILQPFWRNQHGYKLTMHQNEPSSFLPFKSDQHILNSEIKKSEIRRLNINLNKELQSFLKSKQNQTVSIRQIFEILLEAGNYQSIEQNNQNCLLKSKSEQLIDTESSESKYFHRKQEFINSQSKTKQEFLQGSTIIRNRRDSFNSNDNDDSIFQSRDINPLNCSIQDNILVIKAQKGNDIIDLKISAMLEFLTIYETKSQRGSGSGETRNDNCQEKVSLSPQKLEKISESLEEFKQQHNQKFGSQQLTQITNNEQKTDRIIFNFADRNKKSNKKIKLSDMKLFLIIEVQDKKEDIKQVNQEAFKDFKNKILSSLSHELRTPLNCSLQMLETIYQSDILNQNQKKMFILPAINSNYLLLSMINDILDFAQLINGGLNLQFEVFNIVDLIRECMSYFTLQAAYKNIHMELNFEKSIPIQVKSDSMRLKQVIINLLSNAIKFTNQGQISINVDQEEKDLIRISISDTGCGISPEIGNQIFRGLEFNYNNTQFNTEGAGMGLTIANNIAKGLSGNRPIQFVSDMGKGSIFSFFVLDRPQKIIGCKSTKFTIFNRSFTNWKPLFQENSDKIQPSTVFDQLTQNNNRILGSNSVLPPLNHSIIPMNSQFNQSQYLIQNAQTPQVSQMYPIVKSNTFSNTSLPARSFNDFGQRIANYVNSNNNQSNLQQPILTNNNNKYQSYSEDQIHSFNQIPKSFQDLSLKHTLENNLSIEQSNNNQNHQSEGNINVEQSFDIPKYKQTNEQQIHKRNIEHLYRIQQQLLYNNHMQLQNTQPNQKQEQPISSSFKNIALNNNITSLKHIEENNSNTLVKKISCEVDTEYSNLNKPASPLIQQTYYVVAHKKYSKNQQQNYQFKGNQANKIAFEDTLDKHLKQGCFTDEPSGSYQYYQRDDFSNKQLSPKIVSSLRTLHNDGFSVLEQKISRLDDEISQQQWQSQQNQSNKNSTNFSKNPIRIKDLEIEDMQSNLLFFLNSTFVHMQQSINLQQQQQPQQSYAQNLVNNNQNISPNNNNTLPNNSFSGQSNVSINNNNSLLKNNQSRLIDISPRSQKTLQPQIPIQQLSGSYQSLNIQGGKLIKKVLQFESQKTFESNPQNSPHSLPVKEEMRQRVDSIMSRKQESLNIRMENIIEIHENQEHDDNSNSDNNLDYSAKSSMQGSMQKQIDIQTEQVTYKQRIIQKNKQKTCNCSNVLVIDDNEFNLYALEMRLKQYGFKVDTASSGILGQQKVIEKHETDSCCKEYTIIFMDLDMPVQNGFQTTINILDYYKQQNQKPPTISACTAFIQDSEKKKARQAGMKYYITKPVETSYLEKVISKVLFKKK
ncbi:ATPase, histidine kinase-, DNA gyrase B (macronuclear) [Tetrahymena thermophila SB210]|uniref:histidine kinase n=1 Tax=Tetrahymena thermophila (strain SB210) TaxID=312017 RepID=I7M6D0_TETTS|nr:ATPase, histidine kinase-, DNA gyrase B [Tetrahymena thermophila SB210]EAR84982.2 ATPase, histidine kinase-, DNA gyrase B [Tetrahymena thermophila SB210]|eukprot:XP_001032645.2 ATPase, histidine kinase-, DNA gyrase B [Tetrahymena thermophila SB210]